MVTMAEEKTIIDVGATFDRLRAGLSTEAGRACIDMAQHLHEGGAGGVHRLNAARQWAGMAPKFETLKTSAEIARLRKVLDEKKKARAKKNSGMRKPLAVVASGKA